ncbi:MAG: replicative DNA helicase, partial [Clostridia bacterium]|nr:replicative DNA helicase [Clostridia bacterium]
MPNNQTIVSLDDVQLPYSLEAEQAVLGCVLTEPDCITQVLILLKSDHFYLPQH